jgi:dimethylamine monooxygenase subunit B
VSFSNLQMPAKVTEVVRVTPQIKRFRLEPAHGGEFRSFSGGAHIIIEMNDGHVVRRNAYSLMSHPKHASSYMISVLRDEAGRGGSRFMHDQIKEGMIVQISHPVNLFAPTFNATKHLLIAGGIGITPFVAMMEQLSSENRPFELHYAARSQKDAAYAETIAERFGPSVNLYFSDLRQRLDIKRALTFQPLGTHLYVCGPERLIEDVVAIATAEGWPKQNIHLERFMAAAIGAPYDVELARSRRIVSVGSTQSMLEAIEAAGVDAPYFCRGGACGQCETAVVLCDGKLVHADHFLTEEVKASRTKVMPCVSRFEGKKLVLDL